MSNRSRKSVGFGRFNRLIQLVEMYSNWLPVLVFITSFVIIGLFITFLPSRYQNNESSDYRKYYLPVGRSIADGNGVRVANGSPAVRYPPGYPVIIAGTFLISDTFGVAHDSVVQVMNLVFASLSTTLLFVLARFFWGPGSSLLVALVWLFHPISLWSTKQPNSEIPFMSFFLASMLFFLIPFFRPNRAWAVYISCGILIGLSMLIRPAAIGMGFVMSFLIFRFLPDRRSRNRLLLVALVLIGNLAVVAPWQLWMNAHTHSSGLLSTGGPSSVVDGLTYAVNTKDYRQETSVPADVIKLQEEALAESNQLRTSYSAIADFLSDKVTESPMAVFKLFGLKVIRSWYGTDSTRYETVLSLVQVVFLLTVCVGAVKLWQHRSEEVLLLTTVCIFVLYFWGMTMMVLSIVRYMLPAIALLTLLIPGIWAGPVMYTKQAQD
jgi:4-amino-4-deoxy-L-arabinose transferase-like glycosyltransferase